MKLTDRVRAVREASLVERCHNLPHHGSYNLGFHQYGVATLCHLLWPDNHALTVAALYHDQPERWTGDIPSQVIRDNPELAAVLARRDALISSTLGLPCEHGLGDVDFARFKACDRLEFWLWCQDQLAFGNQHILNALESTEETLANDPHTPPEVLNLFMDLREEGWKRHKETF